MDHVIEISGQTIDLFKTRRYINDAMSILSSTYDTACEKKVTTITCTDVVSEYLLPIDCFGIERVTLNGYKFNNYLVLGNTIRFDYLGTYTIKYNAQAVLPSRKVYEKELGTDIPSINSAYHRPICFYIAAQLFKVNDPENNMLMTRFNSMSSDTNNKLLKQRRKGSRIKAPLFR